MSSHVERRMARRGFAEVELRKMLEDAARVRRAHVAGRFVVHARHAGRPWIVVVEPDAERMCILVITAYPVEVE